MDDWLESQFFHHANVAGVIWKNIGANYQIVVGGKSLVEN